MSPKHRPPRLEPRVGEQRPTPAPTLEERLERAKLAGRTGTPGPTEFRRFVERFVGNDRAALGELAPLPGLTLLDAWAAITAIFGATADHPAIDPARTIAGVHRAASRLAAAARSGARIALATAVPASLLPFHLELGRLARRAGAEIADADDVGPLRVDGRTRRYLRFLDGVVVVTDGRSLEAVRSGDAAREWLFVVPRPALVVADGPFAEVAWEAGVEVIALVGLDRAAMAVPAARDERCTLVPVRTDRPARAYAPLVSYAADAFAAALPAAM